MAKEQKKQKEKCPLCEVSEETLQRLKEGEKKKTEKENGKTRDRKEE